MVRKPDSSMFDIKQCIDQQDLAVERTDQILPIGNSCGDYTKRARKGPPLLCEYDGLPQEPAVLDAVITLESVQ
ncbi:unnamed protein product [Prunus armeniaca]|uniref:Uncharacterized protein n=1 Tax=Prunus armeniaca TaxID=36596 RepID=A0A6J5Y5P4_PRUAR|nr:unnamed protein product [Prunus armeniaca]